MTQFNIEDLERGITGAMSPDRPKVPEGEYQATVIAEPPWTLRDTQKPTGEVAVGDKKDGSQWYRVTYWMQFNEPGNDLVHDRVMGFECFLDIDPDAKQLSTKEGDNRNLAKVRIACHQNDPNSDWALKDPIGCSVLARVGNRANKQEPDNPYREIVHVSPLP